MNVLKGSESLFGRLLNWYLYRLIQNW